ncbi:hypothetical protein Anas_06378, partial [Armadillidium nasatum]
ECIKDGFSTTNGTFNGMEYNFSTYRNCVHALVWFKRNYLHALVLLNGLARCILKDMVHANSTWI